MAALHKQIVRFRSGLHTFSEAEMMNKLLNIHGSLSRTQRFHSQTRRRHVGPKAYTGFQAIAARVYFKYVLKKVSIVSQGMTSSLSYKSTWLALGMISNSLLSPVSFLKASSLK